MSDDERVIPDDLGVSGIIHRTPTLDGVLPCCGRDLNDDALDPRDGVTDDERIVTCAGRELVALAQAHVDVTRPIEKGSIVLLSGLDDDIDWRAELVDALVKVAGHKQFVVIVAHGTGSADVFDVEQSS